MKNAASIEIDCPIEDVFLLTNEHVAEWSIVVVEDEVIAEKPGYVGTTFRTVTVDHGQRMVFEGVVTKYNSPHLSAIHLTGSSFDIEAEYTFEDLGARTRVTQASNVTGKGLYRMFFFLFGWMMGKANCKAAENELESLKRFCEERTATPAS